MTMPILTNIAHRGGHLDTPNTPENSLAAIKQSLSLGVDAIEIDIWNIQGELVVTHDRCLGRLLPGNGMLIEQSLDSLMCLKLCNGETTPTLRQVLEVVGNQCTLNIEIKGPNCAIRLAQELTRYCRDTRSNLDNYIVSSFDQRQLQQLKVKLPELKRGVLLAGIPLDNAELCEPLKPYFLGLHIGALDQELIDDAQNRGYKVWVYTANTEMDWQQLVELKVDGVFTDCPKQLKLFNEKQISADNSKAVS